MIEEYTLKFRKTHSGYMGQLEEWPEVITEGCDLDECFESLKDALNQMVLAYKELGKEIPQGSVLLKTTATVS